MFYDVDDKGIDARINEVKTEIGPLFSCANTLNNNGDIVYDDEKFKVGVYIFADHKFASGTLENILLPLMKQGNEEIFNDAEKFLNKHKNNDRMKPLKFVKDEAGNISERRSDRANKYHHAKSLLGVVGQLQNSGTSNTVCIEKADYITLGKISASQPCQEIIDLFKRIITTSISSYFGGRETRHRTRRRGKGPAGFCVLLIVLCCAIAPDRWCGKLRGWGGWFRWGCR